MYERTDEKDKKNYRPIIVFSNISKLNKRCIHNKLTNILNHFYQSFNVFQARIQYTTLPFSDGRENEKKIRDNKGVFAAVLTDLSEAFDCIPHDLITAKLNAFSFHKSLSFTSAYLYKRK